ncbi:lysozyme [Methylobacterium sp. Leaf113]|uniref:lysozyme n=1 Tax=Methylobacterium sp. Leaf113 TaxID=1736259 RepID=UPI0009EA3556|nr:lysozyme [Methylobacterium sp. Leaf113]
MTLSAIGEAVLIAREGRRLSAYRDSVGVWTIGIGHTSAAGPPLVTPGLRLTEAACDALFRRDVARYIQAVATAVGDDLPDHAFDALVSLCFNIGPTAFARSTVVRRLKVGDRDGAGKAFLLWNRPAELIPRRGAEVDQFRTPYAEALPRARRGDAAAIPMPNAATPPLPTARRTVPRLPLSPRAPAQAPTKPQAPVQPEARVTPETSVAPKTSVASKTSVALRVPVKPGALATLWSAVRRRLRGEA